MPHLSAERLAALADAGTTPEAHEREHLLACSDCAVEHHAYAALVGGARAERRAIAAPLTDWSTLATALRAEGLVHDRGTERTRVQRSLTSAPWLRAAAAVALLAGGLAAGRASAVSGPLALEPPLPAAVTADIGSPLGETASWPAEELIPDYRTAAEAEAALRRFEVAYQHAAAFLAGTDTAGRLDATEDYRTRLVALDRAGRTMREAMEKAPYDPVLTGYYLTTLGQREATLRQLNVAVPAGARLNSF